MIGLGTLINTGAVIGGGLVGLIFKKGLKESTQDALMKACGVSTLFIGISGAMTKMLAINGNTIDTKGTMLLVISLIIGTVIGEICRLEAIIEGLGERIKKAVKRDRDSKFVEGFVNSSLIICVGAMAVVGSVQDGISGDFTMLALKGVLDCIIVMIFASSHGVGAIFSAIPVFVLQGSITLLAAVCGSFVSDAIINDIGYIGSVLVFCVGVNIVFGKKFRVGNMVPAIIVPVVYEIIIKYIN